MTEKFAKLVFAVCITAVFTCSSLGQQRIMISIAAPENDGQEAFDEHFDLLQSRVLARLDAAVEEVRVACDLNEEEQAELNTAVVTAAKTVIQNNRTEKELDLRKQQKRAGFVVDENGDIVEGEIEKRARNRLQVSFRSLSELAVERSSAIKRAINDSLTEEQKQKWQIAVTERESFLRNSAVDLFVSRVDFALLLSEEQRTQLSQAILNHELADALADDIRYGELTPTRSGSRYKAIQEPKFVDLVGEILDEDQLRGWKAVFEPELAMLKRPNTLGARSR